MRRKLTVVLGFFVYVARRFVEERCLLWAGMLTYSTLLTLVPLVVVVLSVVSVFPVFEQWSGEVERFILQNFVPAAGGVARDYLAEFVARAKELSLIGVTFLVLSALLLMFSIDTIINHIWRVHRTRTLGAKFLVYWSVLTLGPVLMGASIVLSISIIPALERAVTDPGMRLLVLRAVPFAISVVVFTLVYFFVPNVRVPLFHAAGGGVLSAALFEATKVGFAFYLREFPAYEVIYGAFAIVPIFLVWTYLVWTVLLFGGCFATALGSYARARPTGAWPDEQEFLLIYRVLQHLSNEQNRGGALSPDELLGREPDMDDGQLMRALAKLEAARIVLREEDGGFRLVRDVRELTLLDLYRAMPVVFPDLSEVDDGDRAWLLPLRRTFEALDEPLERTLAQPLARLFEASRDAERSSSNGPEVDPAGPG